MADQCSLASTKTTTYTRIIDESSPIYAPALAYGSVLFVLVVAYVATYSPKS